MKMLNNIKNILVKQKNVLLLFVVVFVLAACTSNNNTNNPDGDGGDGAQVYDIVWWGLFDKEEVIQPLIDQYKVVNPNVNVDYVQITDGVEAGNLLENYRARLEENLIDNEPLDTPDIFTLHNTWLGRYSQYMSPAPSSIFSVQTITDQYYPVVTQDFVRGTSVYAVPLYMDSLALIVNKDLMISQSAVDSDGPETNWFDFKDQAERLTSYKESKVDIAGFSAGAPNVEFATGVLSALLLQSDIEIVTKDAVTGFSSAAILANDSETQTILDFYKKFESEAEKMTWNKDIPNEVAAFLSEKLVVYAAPSWRLNDILRLNQKYNLGLNVETYPLPQINPGDAASNVDWADYWGIGVAVDSQKRGQSNAVWEFVKFISEDAQLRTLSDKTKEQPDRLVEVIYPKKSMNNDLKNNELLGVYVNALERAKSWDMIDGFLVDDVIKDTFDQVPSDDTLQGGLNAIISQRTNLLTSGSAQ